MNQDSLHINFEKLTDLIVGTLSEAEKAEVSEHLNLCPNCAMLKMRTEKTIGVMQSDRMEEVPSHILERTFDLLRERKIAPAKPSLLKRILATLETESSSLTPAFGLRSGQTEAARQLWLTTDDAEIDLRLRQTGETWNVAGQVFSSFLGGEAVLQSESAELKSEMSDQGEFSFDEVSSGDYKLILRFANTEIEIPEINVGE